MITLPFFLVNIPLKEKNLFLRFLAKTELIEEFMFELISANTRAIGSDRDFIQKHLCPMKFPKNIINDAFPWEFTRKGKYFWSQIHSDWGMFLIQNNNG